MAKITFIEHSGTERVVDVATGESVMRGALDNLVPGILGDCGGSCSCATCHTYIDPAWLSRLPPMADDEQMLLDGALGVKENSRLCCQIRVTDEMDGLVLRTPVSQI